jgi:hypothetical protein
MVCAQQSAPPPTASSPTAAAATLEDKPLPDIRALFLDVDRNTRAAEAARNQYTYHVSISQQELDGHGNIKKTSRTDYDSVSVDGVRVDRLVAKDGHPLTADEAKKEDARIDKEIAKAKERRAKATAKGETTDSRGDVILPASRILELGTFSHPRRVLLNGRPTIVVDYAGDPNAKKRSIFEGIVRDLVGTVWIDEQDRVLVRGEGRFLNDFKIGGGLVLNIHKGLHFEADWAKVNNEVWLPTVVTGEGSARILLVDGVNGRFRLVTSDYRKFHSGATIVGMSGALGDNDQPLPTNPPPADKPVPPTPPSH